MTEQIAIYIGAGTDVRPIRALGHIKRFVYIDTRPQTQCPEYDRNGDQYDCRFIRDIAMKMEVLDFNWASIPMRKRDQLKLRKLHFFKDNDVTLDYYVNTCFPIETDNPFRAEINDWLSKANTLIVSGYLPHKSIIESMAHPIKLCLWQGTCFQINEDDNTNNLLKVLHDTNNAIASITYYEKQYIGTEFFDIHSVHKYQSTIPK